MVESQQELLAEIDGLRRRLKESEELLDAIRKGDVDALVVSGPNGDRVYTIEGADYAYRIAIETINEGAITLTSEGTILYCNQRFAEIVGSPMERVIGASIYDFVHAENCASLRMLLQNTNKGELSILAGDEILPVYLSASALNLSGLNEARCLVVTDLTDLKQSELRENEARRKAAEAIEAERQRLFDVLETLPAMICLLTPDYHVAFANRSFRQKFGESLGRHCYEYCLGRIEPCEFCETYDVLKTGKPHHWQVAGPDGSIIDAYDFPFTDTDGSPMILEMSIDITEHKLAEAELRVAKEDAEAAAAAKAAFLANMSHELRTPMNAVIGFTSLLLDESLPSEHKELVEGIRAGGEAMMSIINDILEFSRTEKEKIEMEKRPFSLKHCIESSLDMVASQASQKGLNLSYTISYGTPDGIIGDHGRLRQVLVNLLGNAVKFTDEGGVSVTVSSRPIEANRHQRI